MRKARDNGVQGPSLHVVEPHPLAATALRAILRRFRDVTFHRGTPDDPRTVDSRPSAGSGQAPRGNDKSFDTAERPVIVVVDAGVLAETPGQLMRWVRRNDARGKLIVLDAEATTDCLLELLFLGVAGFVPYNRAPLDLVGAVRTVARGEIWMPDHILRQFG